MQCYDVALWLTPFSWWLDFVAFVYAEAAFEPARFISELARRGIRVEERIEEHGIIDSRTADMLSLGYVPTLSRASRTDVGD
jgi:hypothetical protein